MPSLGTLVVVALLCGGGDGSEHRYKVNIVHPRVIAGGHEGVTVLSPSGEQSFTLTENGTCTCAKVKKTSSKNVADKSERHGFALAKGKAYVLKNGKLEPLTTEKGLIDTRALKLDVRQPRSVFRVFVPGQGQNGIKVVAPKDFRVERLDGDPDKVRIITPNEGEPERKLKRTTRARSILI